MEGLKPCPFCGGKAIPQAIDYDDGDSTWWVRCSVCGAETDEYNGGTEAEADAIKAWNTRKEPITIMSPITVVSPGEPQTYVPLRTCHIETRVIDDIEEDFCTACGNELGCYYQPHYCPNCGAKVVEE